MAFPRHISAAVDFLIHGSDRWLRKALHTSWPAFPQSQLSPGGAGSGIHARKPRLRRCSRRGSSEGAVGTARPLLAEGMRPRTGRMLSHGPGGAFCPESPSLGRDDPGGVGGSTPRTRALSAAQTRDTRRCSFHHPARGGVLKFAAEADHPVRLPEQSRVVGIPPPWCGKESPVYCCCC